MWLGSVLQFITGLCWNAGGYVAWRLFAGTLLEVKVY